MLLSFHHQAQRRNFPRDNFSWDFWPLMSSWKLTRKPFFYGLLWSWNSWVANCWQSQTCRFSRAAMISFITNQSICALFSQWTLTVWSITWPPTPKVFRYTVYCHIKKQSHFHHQLMLLFQCIIFPSVMKSNYLFYSTNSVAKLSMKSSFFRHWNEQMFGIFALKVT